jgi:hypothetical protein
MCFHIQVVEGELAGPNRGVYPTLGIGLESGGSSAIFLGGAACRVFFCRKSGRANQTENIWVAARRLRQSDPNLGALPEFDPPVPRKHARCCNRTGRIHEFARAHRVDSTVGSAPLARRSEGGGSDVNAIPRTCDALGKITASQRADRENQGCGASRASQGPRYIHALVRDIGPVW